MRAWAPGGLSLFKTETIDRFLAQMEGTPDTQTRQWDKGSSLSKGH